MRRDLFPSPPTLFVSLSFSALFLSGGARYRVSSFYYNTVTRACPKTSSRECVIIEPSCRSATARFGDPLIVDNAYSLLTYIVGARSSVRSRFPTHRSTSDLSADFAHARIHTGKLCETRSRRRERERASCPENPNIIDPLRVLFPRYSIKLAFYRLKYRKFKLDNAENREITASAVQLLVSLYPQTSLHVFFSPCDSLYRSTNREENGQGHLRSKNSSARIRFFPSAIFARRIFVPSRAERTQIPLVAILGCALRQIRAACSLAARQILLDSLRERVSDVSPATPPPPPPRNRRLE